MLPLPVFGGKLIWFSAVEPDTVNQFVPMPALKELVCASNRQRYCSR
jgi:hypothetical protein